MTLTLNDHTLAEAALPASWTEIHLVGPQRLWNEGENAFCVGAAKKRPGDESDDLADAAAVVKVQLP